MSKDPRQIFLLGVSGVHFGQFRPENIMAKKKQLDDAERARDRGDWKTVLRIIAAFPHLGEHREAITRGWSAVQNPGFYAELGHRPAELWATAVRAVCARYEWVVPEPMPALPGGTG